MTQYKKHYVESKQEWIVKSKESGKWKDLWSFSIKAYGDLAEEMADISIKHDMRFGNVIRFNEDTATLICLSKGIEYHVAFDIDDLDLIAPYKWSINRTSKEGLVYCSKSDGTKMHRVVMNLTDPSKFIDHIDRNGLNNVKSNLRITDYAGNAKNRTTSSNNSTGKNGVFYHTSKKLYIARVSHDGKRKEKSFSVSKYGEQLAKEKAIQARIELEGLLGYIGE